MSVLKCIALWLLEPWQSPSNAHAYRLYIFNDHQHRAYRFVVFFAAISEAFDYYTVFEELSNFLNFFINPAKQPDQLKTQANLSISTRRFQRSPRL